MADPNDARSGSTEADSSGAEVIPIGTRGRPGRGSGGRTPSRTSRDLGAERSPRTDGSAVDPAAGSVTSNDADLGPSATQPSPADPPAPTSIGAGEGSGAGAAAPREPTTTRDRGPLAHIGVTELLDALRGAATELFGDDAEQQLARFLAFLRRRLTGDYTIDDFGFDPEITEHLLIAALRPLAQRWFRVEVRGADNIPETGGALVVSNHSGTVPLDGLMTMVSVHDETGRFLRPLGADLVFRLPLVSTIARRGGTTLACNDDAERLLSSGQLVGVWPEGFKGIGKPFSERYKLQRFGRGGFVAAALRTGVPIIPLSVVGAEEIYPLVGNVPSLARLLGIPYIPITPTFPLLGPLGLIPLPSKWILEFGEPIPTDEYEPGAVDDPMLVFEVTDQVRETIQSTLYRLLIDRGGAFG